MYTRLLKNGNQNFKFVRPSLINGGEINEVDPAVLDQIEILDRLLSKRAFEVNDIARFKEIIGKDLSEIVEYLQKNNRNHSIENIIDYTKETARLEKVKVCLGNYIDSFNSSLLLQRKSFMNFLFARVKFMGFEDPLAMAKFIADEEDGGVKLLYDYLAKEATEAIIIKENIELEDITDNDLPIDKVQIIKVKEGEIKSREKELKEKEKELEKKKAEMKEKDARLKALEQKLKKLEADANNNSGQEHSDTIVK